MTKTMRVVEISSFGGPEVLKLNQREIPTPEGNQILIQNASAGVNRPDILQRSGSYNPPKEASDLPGLESAGTIVAVGERVTRWKIGDEVCALLPGGGYAEYSLTHENHALPVPAGMDFNTAAAICETYFTVWSNVFMRGCLKAGETILIHGGSSGIGTTAIQLAELFGARVFTTVGSAEKAEVCKELGAELVINYKNQDFVEEIRGITGRKGVDLILDMVGGDYLPKNVKILADDGRLVQIAFLQGPKIELNFAQLMVRRLTITGSTLRPQSDLAKARIAEDLMEKVFPYLETGRIKPIMDSTFKLDEVVEAHKKMESSKHIGKIVLEI
ncbi:MAG: NAD(P)H-quinone oxidoreductase [Paracoccaceae bacterium]|nr:NAD(P)H-quinone oxidoreductase [Paracoccaceae bacterium]MDE2738091.1 NAD(P)H-quinone oxidoreductase [Paracoccaceae bacterium]MDE2758941.1 NAD(P)H-quinone oxidoreductase [Paracoccaceae bacterium]MDE2918113.1 NAD(P)H-quinone oxidoreductase [Paracoccaceae bacterium]